MTSLKPLVDLSTIPLEEQTARLRAVIRKNLEESPPTLEDFVEAQKTVIEHQIIDTDLIHIVASLRFLKAFGTPSKWGISYLSKSVARQVCLTYPTDMDAFDDLPKELRDFLNNMAHPVLARTVMMDLHNAVNKDISYEEACNMVMNFYVQRETKLAA